MKNILLLVCLAAAAAFSSSAALAGTAVSGSINNVYFMQNGTLLFFTDATQVSPPACAVVPSRFAIDGTTAAGRIQAAAILTAYAIGKKIAIWGADNCSVWGDTETVNFSRL